MSEWGSIEDAIVAALSGLSDGGEALLATVKGQTWQDRKALHAAIGRERLPAAYVMAMGRDEGDRSYRGAGTPLFSVLYAVSSERAAEEARRGGIDTTGVFAIADASAAALQGLEPGDNRRLCLLDERAVASVAGTALWEQRFEIRRRAGLFYPLFGGDRLIGELSEVQVEVGPMSRAASRFAFPGVDGVFERFVGARERPIFWRGQLRAATEWDLDAMEADIETTLKRGEVSSVFDVSGRAFHDCVLSGFKRKGTRGRDALTGEALQDFELEFTQLMG